MIHQWEWNYFPFQHQRNFWYDFLNITPVICTPRTWARVAQLTRLLCCADKRTAWTHLLLLWTVVCVLAWTVNIHIMMLLLWSLYQTERDVGDDIFKTYLWLYAQRRLRISRRWLLLIWHCREAVVYWHSLVHIFFHTSKRYQRSDVGF